GSSSQQKSVFIHFELDDGGQLFEIGLQIIHEGVVSLIFASAFQCAPAVSSAEVFLDVVESGVWINPRLSMVVTPYFPPGVEHCARFFRRYERSRRRVAGMVVQQAERACSGELQFSGYVVGHETALKSL